MPPVTENVDLLTNRHFASIKSILTCLGQQQQKKAGKSNLFIENDYCLFFFL